MHSRNLNRTIDRWLLELDNYDLRQLLMKPSPDSWSLGQVYMHLVDNVDFYIEQIKICLSTNDNADCEASANGKEMFLNNCFPDEFIEGPPENAVTAQPESKEQIVRLFTRAKEEMNKLALEISLSKFNGKTKHPGLNYFSASDWLQFADMHFRHHLRQKKRIDDFLKKNHYLSDTV